MAPSWTGLCDRATGLTDPQGVEFAGFIVSVTRVAIAGERAHIALWIRIESS